MTNQELQAKIREYREYKLLADEATATADGIADEIKAHMNAEGTDELKVDIFVVRYKPVTSSRFDSGAFKKTHGELFSQYSKETTSRRFTVA
jgi:predicted phage-related endonuclease